MSDTEILEKYGNVKLEFFKCYKNNFTYRSANDSIYVEGTATHRGEFYKIMSVGDLWQEMETFDFKTKE